MMRKHTQFAIFLLLIVVYLCTIFLLPTDPMILEKYDLTQSRARLFSLTVAIPLILVWLSAFYGYSAFKKYSETVKDTAEGLGLGRLVSGLMILAFSLPILAIISALFNYFAVTAPQYLQTTVVVRQIIVLAFPLVAFILISSGAEHLTMRLKKKMTFLQNNTLSSFVIIVASSLFAWAIITLADSNAAPKNIYSFPEWAIVAMVIIPYLYMWYRGLVAVYYLNFYKNHVKGHIYKQAFAYLSRGLAVVILLAMSIQFLTVLTPQLQRLNFTPILAIVYILVALYALGYGMIAVGAKKLKMIEEV